MHAASAVKGHVGTLLPTTATYAYPRRTDLHLSFSSLRHRYILEAEVLLSVESNCFHHLVVRHVGDWA